MQSVHFDKLKADLGLAKNLKAKNKVRCHTGFSDASRAVAEVLLVGPDVVEEAERKEH